VLEKVTTNNTGHQELIGAFSILTSRKVVG